MAIKALIFDLDGVITDTAEFHYRAWKQLADEEGIPFTRADNEHLRGVSRRESLLLLLKGRQVEEDRMQEMMERKNRYYTEMLAQITPGDLLPGVLELFHLLEQANVRCALASASRNAAVVVDRLGIADRLAVLADGSSVTRQKPAPDLFRYAAARLGFLPGECMVVEDAAAGIEAAINAGMTFLALGPAERFAEIEQRFGPVPRRADLEGVTLGEIKAAALRDPTWRVSQTDWHADRQHHMETVLTAGNGYFCSRGSLEEGYSGDHPLTLAHGMFDDMPIARTELANLPDWLDVAITVNGQPVRLDQGDILSFHRYLDLQQGILHREIRWQAPDGVVLDMTFERFACYLHEHVGALRFLITAVNRPCHVTVVAGIDGHVSNEDLLHWQFIDQGQTGQLIWLHSRTRHSELDLATAAVLSVGGQPVLSAQQCPGQPHLVVSEDLDTAQTLTVEKLVSYTASRDTGADAVDVVGRAIKALDGQTYAALRADQVRAWRELWRECDVVIEGDDDAQLAIRFNLFQLIIAAPQHDDRVSIGAKTLSGLGYRGHVFWDTEIFILPFFIYTRPDIARNMLMYRYHTLAGARQKAAQNGFAGAQYAWESAVTGEEVTPTWVPDFRLPGGLVRIWTGDIEIHISADVAYALMQYWQATGDDAFMRDYGAEMILDTARFWGERAEPEEVDGQRCYAFRDVIGPDEYHDHVDNNTYTNRMAQWHLQTAQTVLAWLETNYPAQARALRDQLELDEARLEHWQDVIDHVTLYHDPDTGLMLQFEGFFDLQRIDPDVIARTERSMQVVLGIEGANESQVIKQADVIMLLCLLRDEYDARTWQTNWDTYMPITDHRYGSSLGPSFHAWAACEMGKPDEGYDHFMLAARADLYDVRGNANDGIHGASAGGLWQALVFGFAGLRLTADGLALKPHLPAHWKKLSFCVRYRGEKIHVEVTQGGEARITAAN